MMSSVILDAPASPAHMNENGIGSSPDLFSGRREKCRLGTRLTHYQACETYEPHISLKKGGRRCYMYAHTDYGLIELATFIRRNSGRLGARSKLRA